MKNGCVLEQSESSKRQIHVRVIRAGDAADTAVGFPEIRCIGMSEVLAI